MAAKTPVAAARWKLAKPRREEKCKLDCQEVARGEMECKMEGKIRWVIRLERKRWRWLGTSRGVLELMTGFRSVCLW